MKVRALLASAGLLAVFAGSAVAQEPGVHYDPDSPAGKQYAIPLDAARDVGNDHAGIGGSAGSGEGPGPAAGGLFGVGVRPKASTDSSGESGEKTRDRSGETTGRGSPRLKRRTESGLGAAPSGEGIRAVAARADSEQSGLTIGLVLLAGLAAALCGVAIRRRRRTVS